MSEPCRLCLRSAPAPRLTAIFATGTDTHLKILACLPVHVSKEDALPKKICNTCLFKVDDFYRFRNQAMDSENKLTHLQRSESTNLEKNMDRISHCQSWTEWSLNSDNQSIDGEVSSADSKKSLFNSLECIKSNKSFNSPIANDLISVCTQTDDSSNVYRLPEIKQEALEHSLCEAVLDDFDESFSLKDEPIADDSKSNLVLSDEMDFSNPSILTPVVSLRKDESKRSKKKSKIKIKKQKLDIDSVENLQLGVEYEPAVLQDDVIFAKELWVCCICFKKLAKRREMLKHYRTHSLKSEIKKEREACDVESMTFEDTKRIQKFECKFCDQIYDSRVLYINHLMLHTNDKPYKCSLCEKTFKGAVEILKHGRKAHSYLPFSEGTDEDVTKVHPQPTSKRFMCDLCDEKFVYMKYLLTHRNSVHPEARDRRLINRCMHCRREFAHLNSLRRHLRSHTGERNFLCYMCGKALSSREHLKFHMRIHTGFKPNICQTCGKGFVKKCNLVLHERVHSGERPHVCSHCGKAFSQRSTLVIHERYHSGTRPYVCKLCNKGFVAKGLLSMHLKSTCV